MANVKGESVIGKKSITESLSGKESSLKKYQGFFVGESRVSKFLVYEMITTLSSLLPGAVGYLSRKLWFPYLFHHVGSNVNWGRNLALRHPGKMTIGHRIAVDDNCLLDAKGAGIGEFTIGDDVVIARDTIIQAKNAYITIGRRCIIGSQCQLSSVGGIQIGDHVMIAGQCYIGGGRYHTEDADTPIMDQGLYSRGPVVVENDVWIGAGVVILDGVRIGEKAVIGAGSVVTKSIPSRAVAFGNPAKIQAFLEKDNS